MKLDDVMTDPKALVSLELQNQGFDIDKIKIPKKVYLLADSIFDEMISRKCAKYTYPLGGKLYIFNENDNVGFVKSNMCSPAIATQAEDLIAGGVNELVHIGFAGGLQSNMKPGDLVVSDGAFNDTAVARLYGFDYEFIESTKSLTDKMEKLLLSKNLPFTRGRHWTTDAGYRETWGQIIEYSKKGALCVEMEGVGLFTIAKYRKCSASAIYIISDVLANEHWNLGWGENCLDKSISNVIDTIINDSKKDLCDMSLAELWELFPIVLVKHNSDWVKWFNDESNYLKSILSNLNLIRISHMGSTAINGICAKPTVDILIEFSNKEELKKAKTILLSHQYLCMSENDTRIVLNKGYTKYGFANRVFHIHLRIKGDNDELYFRDYMNLMPDLAKEYELLKLSLYKQYEHDRDSYTNSKSEFVIKYTKAAKHVLGTIYN